ncbi:glycosyltransferase [Leptospira sp. 2 VSF19]|uniref:Glycosyltransferase n=1 Tax=Leptospira soteropolitanensis TaxID=2950025 RepID=A0AAW5VKU3_9LEPT|nr:glycosyltransferase [Leptospira soteropolitanensis]MCW7493177.1 glycosyltransferase [Leptospira soteropolitanensis]MCW7500754.1 glycosyltransferase [Leptospira soteropolitanensis]MCW7523027.1 glycosyltransferase [Leptospira soteropolitanensis]MCW7526866.1 glycosyltransferase [Leptospira soteropolitanensis]MCW7530745.1 glycosyltransferase [Leptospira soteropolitanensis]
MNLAIEASNIVDGGGLNHLRELLNQPEIATKEISKIVIWSSENTLKLIPDSTIVIKKTNPFLNSGKLKRFIWQLLYSKDEFKENAIDLVFVPGGIFLGSYSVPVISMSQNMLLYEWREMARYGFSSGFLRLFFLFFLQSYSFIRSKSILFLTEYAKNTITKKLRLNPDKSVVIPHGINDRFSESAHKPKTLAKKDSFDLLYVSFIGMYKHQWKVVEAISSLRDMGYDLKLTLVGNVVDTMAGNLLKASLEKYDPKREFVNHKLNIGYEEIHKEYKDADLFIYASSCENMPMILMEAMRSSLPILSSKMGPMPEILGEAGEYFDPTNATDLVKKIDLVLKSKERLGEMAEIAYQKSLAFTWKNTQKLTFSYFMKVYREF